MALFLDFLHLDCHIPFLSLLRDGKWADVYGQCAGQGLLIVGCFAGRVSVAKYIKLHASPWTPSLPVTRSLSLLSLAPHVKGGDLVSTT